MKALKIILIILLFFISIVFTFNKPGARPLESFISLSEKGAPLSHVLLKYPPGVYLIYKNIIKRFPPNQEAPLVNQKTWSAWKIVSLISYLLSWIALLYLTKEKGASSRLGTSLFYFASASITLIGLSLGLFEALAVAPVIISLHFLFKRKLFLATTFCFVAISLNWYLLILAPFYLAFILKSFPKTNLSLWKIIYWGLPLLLCGLLLRLYFETLNFPEISIASKYLGFYSLFNTGLSLSKNITSFSFFGVNFYQLLLILIWGGTFIVISYAIREILKIKFNIFLLAALVLGILTLGVLTQNLYLVFLFLFLVMFFFILKRLHQNKKVTTVYFLQTLFVLFCTGSLFFPGLSDGNLIFIPTLALVLYTLAPNKTNGKLVLGVNIVTFMAIFLFNGVSRLAPLKGMSFELTRVLLTFGVLLFYSKAVNINNLKFVNKFLIVFLVLFNFALLASGGSPDIVSWRQYSYALSRSPNPFYAQTVVDQRYPPLSMVILGTFTTLWKNSFGLKPIGLTTDPINVVEYGYPAKASVLFFYFLSLLIFFRLSNSFKNGAALTKTQKVLTGLTVFSLIIQTQGFVDFNIHVIPTLLLAIFALFKKKYLLSGLLLGITISIKWQPIILVPVFGATLFTFEEGIKEAFRKSLKFIFGLILVPIIAWALVIREPGGWDAFNRSFLYLKQGAPMLSGQALNLNWIVTYAVHIFQPEKDVSLSHLGGLNRQIGSPLAPKIFQGYLFFIAAFFILLFYWLKQKKTIVNFMAASIMIFFSHQILNKSAYEKHLFYTVILMLFLYLIRPSKFNRTLLTIFDVMAIMNLIFFYGFAGPKIVDRMLLGFDITILFSLLYLLIYLYIFVKYLRGKLLVST